MIFLNDSFRLAKTVPDVTENSARHSGSEHRKRRRRTLYGSRHPQRGQYGLPPLSAQRKSKKRPYAWSSVRDRTFSGSRSRPSGRRSGCCPKPSFGSGQAQRSYFEPPVSCGEGVVGVRPQDRNSLLEHVQISGRYAGHRRTTPSEDGSKGQRSIRIDLNMLDPYQALYRESSRFDRSMRKWVEVRPTSTKPFRR